MDERLLRAEIIKQGMTYAQVARAIGVSDSTFWRRMRKGNFGLDEVNAMIRVLNIQNPGRIFFARSAT